MEKPSSNLNKEKESAEKNVKEMLFTNFSYKSEELDRIVSIDYNQDARTLFLNYDMKTSVERLSLVPDPEMRESLSAMSKILNVSMDGAVWFFFGSNSAYVAGAKHTGMPDDIDGLFDWNRSRDFKEELNKSPFISEIKSEKVFTGAEMISGSMTTSANKLREFEIAGQVMLPVEADPAKREDEHEGFILPGYDDLTIVHRYSADGTNYENHASPEALIKFYLRVFAHEFSQLDYEAYRKDKTIKLKHAKRLAIINNLGVDTFEDLIGHIDRVAHKNKPENQDKHDLLISSLREMHERFHTAQENTENTHNNLSKQLIEFENYRRTEASENPLKIENRGQEIEIAVDILTKEVTKDIEILSEGNLFQENNLLDLFSVLLPLEQKTSANESFGDLIKAGDIFNLPIYENENIAAIQAHIKKQVGLNPTFIQDTKLLIQETESTQNLFMKKLYDLKQKYGPGSLLQNDLQEDEFILFTLIDKVDRLFIDRIQTLLNNYQEHVILLKEILAMSKDKEKEPILPPDQEKADAAKKQTEKLKKAIEELRKSTKKPPAEKRN